VTACRANQVGEGAVLQYFLPYESLNRISPSDRGIKVIIYFSYAERRKVENLLKKLGLHNNKDIILIDARSDNKPSASQAA
jgi:hypothetical protein